MQFGLFVVLVLILMDIADSSKFGKGRRQKRKCKNNNCETCFSRNFCTKCNEGFYLHKGSCYLTCPEGFTAVNGTMECSTAQCEMSEWGAWSPCSRTPKQCGKKKGWEERSRKMLQTPLGGMSLCPPTTEKRKCPMPKIACPVEERGRKKDKDEQGKKEKNRNRNKNTEDAKSGSKKRKGQQRVTLMPITPSIPAQ
ncbi:hypothetical protein FKM82_013730 [Ascaphus truei]